MNITPQAPNLSIPTVLNPHTETLRRENHQREIITKPAALHQSVAEKGVSSDRERGRTPAQNSENIDFASLKEKAELANNTITEQNNEQQGEHDHNPPQHSFANETKEDESEVDTSDGDSQAQEVKKERVINELERRDKEVRNRA